MNVSATRRLASVREACAYLKIGRTKMLQMIHDGRIDALRFDGKLLIDLDKVDEFINALPSVRGG